MSFERLILEDRHGHQESALTLRRIALKWQIPLPLLVTAARAGELRNWVVGPGQRLTTESEIRRWLSSRSESTDRWEHTTDIPPIELAFALTSELG